MVKVTVNGQEYYMDGYLKENLDTGKTVIKKDWDMLFACDGNEGSGKSVFVMQIAKYCDPSFDIDRVVFTPGEFRKAIIAAEKYQAIVYDEAYTGLSSRATMSLINRTLISMLAEIRQRNLFVFVVMPCFFDLDKYVALWRSRGLFHVYTGKKFERGYFAFYNIDKKKDLYINGKKFYSYSKPKPNFIGRFTNHYVVDEAAYRKKKRDSLTDREAKSQDKEVQKEIQEELFNKLQESEADLTHEQKMKVLGMPEATYYYKLKNYRKLKGFAKDLGFNSNTPILNYDLV